MKPLGLHARLINQRRMNAFYLSPERSRAVKGQIEITKFSPHEDRPRTLREMFADIEQMDDNSEQP